MAPPLPRQVESVSDQLILEALIPGMTPAQAFAAWTDPAQICRWWPQAAEIDARAGGAYLLAWPQMDWRLRGRYTLFEPPQRLAFTWRWDHDSPAHPERTVQIDLAPDPAGGTRLRLTHGPYSDSPADQEERVAHHLTGWQHFLPRLQSLIPEGR